MLKRCLFVVALVACGGGAKKPAPTMPEPGGDGAAAAPAQSECEKVANHVADIVTASKDAPSGATKDVVVELVKSHCEQDAWSADAKSCFASITTGRDGEACAKQLTADQQTSLKRDADAKFKKPPMEEASDDEADDKASEGKMGGAGAKKPVSAPPAPPKSAPPKGGKGPVKSNDPCEGGE